MAYSLQTVAMCAAGAGTLRVTMTYTPDGAIEPEQPSILRLSGPGGDVEQGGSRGATVDFTGLADGTYFLEWRDEATQQLLAADGKEVRCAGVPSFVLDYATATNATATGGGTITGQASGGDPPLTALLVEAGIAQNATSGQPVTFGNIPAGTYTLRFTDDIGQSVERTLIINPYAPVVIRGCTDPAADNYDATATEDDGSCAYTPAPRFPHFEVPPMQSLRFVVPGSTIRPAFDNVLLANESELDYQNPGYCQKVEQGDTLVMQCQSNYQGAPVLQLRRQADDAVALTVLGQRVQQGAGVTASFEAYFKPDATGRTRVYFNEDALPLPFRPGQRVTISATSTSLDGTYPVRDVLEDAAAAVPYLVLPVPFPGTVRLDGSLATTYTVQQFDTYQFVVPFASIAEGCYNARISAEDTDFGVALAFSEPIDVAAVHPHTKLITYRNFDNAWGLNYSAGLVNRLRVVARFFRRKPAGETTVLRNDDSELELLAASAYRHIELETLLLPDWLHEVLFVAFKHDFVKVDSLRVVLDGPYEIEPVERFTLGKGTANLEARGFLGAGNRDDLGDVDGGPFLLASNSFLLARR